MKDPRRTTPSNEAIDQMGESESAEDRMKINEALAAAPRADGYPDLNSPPPKPKRPRDPELVAMEQLTKVFDAMPEYCKQRVLSWLQAKYGCGPRGERPMQCVSSIPNS